jgi:hypothetical protein
VNFCFSTCVSVVICFRKDVVETYAEECNFFHVWGTEFYPWELFLSQESLRDWLTLIAWRLLADKISQLETILFCLGVDIINSNPSGGRSDAPARWPPSGLCVLN